jgi:peptide/nickel transport system permease protein
MKVIKNGFTLILECLVTIEVLICIGEFPTLFTNLGFHLKDYLHAVINFTVRFFTFQQFTYHIGLTKVPLFPVILGKYIDSMKIFVLGIMTASIIAFVFAYLSLTIFRKRIRFIKKLMELAESVPDLIFILFLQMLVIFIYKKTRIMVVQVVTLNKEAILLPVISMAVPISFYIAKVIILYIEEELGKEYVTLVKSKGFSVFYILNIHVLRNIAEGMFISSKTIIWTMLSTLLIIDKLFNMNALMGLMFTETDSFIIGCILIFIPIFILYRISERLRYSNGKDAN